MRPSHTAVTVRTRPVSRPRIRPDHAPACFEPIEARLLLDSVPFGVADQADRTSVAAVRGTDFLLYQQQEPGTSAWTRQHFGSWIPEDFVPLSAPSFVDPKAGRVYQAVNSPAALAILVDDDQASREDIRILTDEIEGSQPIATRLTTFASADGRVHLAGLTAAGEAVVYRQTGDQS